MATEKRRYVGIDPGKREYTMAITGRDGTMKIHQGKTSIPWRQALYALLEKADKIALEAGNLAFIMARETGERAGSEVRILNAAKLPFIRDAPAKTGKEDAVKLAHLIGERREKKLPVVPLPGGEELAGRKLLANYGREQRNRTGQINTLHALFAHRGHTTAVKKQLSAAEKRKAVIELPGGQER
jgi:hypothetical protein